MWTSFLGISEVEWLMDGAFSIFRASAIYELYFEEDSSSGRCCFERDLRSNGRSVTSEIGVSRSQV